MRRSGPHQPPNAFFVRWEGSTPSKAAHEQRTACHAQSGSTHPVVANLNAPSASAVTLQTFHLLKLLIAFTTLVVLVHLRHRLMPQLLRARQAPHLRGLFQRVALFLASHAPPGRTALEAETTV